MENKPNIQMVRIDERLIHGQGQLWIKSLGVNLVICANDAVSTDDLQQTLMKTVLPKEINVRFWTVERTAEIIWKAAPHQTIFVLVSNPTDALRLAELGFPLDTINIGNIHSAPGKDKVSQFIYLGEEDKEGSLSVIGAVSPAGGDISEPVTQATLRIVKVFWRLDANLAYQRHFPAINWLESYSLYNSMDPWFAKNISEDWVPYKNRVMAILQDESALKEMVQLVGEDALSAPDRLKMEVARSVREDLLQQNAFMEEDTYTSLHKQFMLMKLILTFYDICLEALDKGANINKLIAMEVREPIGRFKYTAEDKVNERFKEIEAALAKEADDVAQEVDF